MGISSLLLEPRAEHRAARDEVNAPWLPCEHAEPRRGVLLLLQPESTVHRVVPHKCWFLEMKKCLFIYLLAALVSRLRKCRQMENLSGSVRGEWKHAKSAECFFLLRRRTVFCCYYCYFSSRCTFILHASLCPHLGIAVECCGFAMFWGSKEQLCTSSGPCGADAQLGGSGLSPSTPVALCTVPSGTPR